MLDLASIVPYYTGHLGAALLKEGGIGLQIGAITYHLDPDYFERQGIHRCDGVLDIVSKLSVRPAGLRQALKAAEYLVNLLAAFVRCLFSRPGVVHIQFLPLLTTGLPVELWFLRALRLVGMRIIYTVHNVLPHDTGDCHRHMYARVYQLADGLICHDDAARVRLIQEFQVDPRKILIIPHGPLFDQAPARDAVPARQALRLPEHYCVVLCQGILRPYKGVDVLLEAWRTIHARGSPAMLVIAGSGTDELQRQIQNTVSAAGISSSVRLDLRFISAADLDNYYSAADILVYPYREVTSSGSLMTGINRGKAIVASRLPAFEQVLTSGENGLLVQPGSPEELAAAIRRLIDDKDLRSRIGRQGTPTGPQWSAIARETIRGYNETFVRQCTPNGQKAWPDRSTM